tara:strand:+ start:115 stop:744 length:630 start_codon:yes stop_codon:yes gene_type:complete
LIPDQSSKKNDIDLIIRKKDAKEYSKYMISLGYRMSYDGERYLHGARSHIHCVHKTMDVHFDTVLGLYYRSLFDKNLFIGGFDDLENSIFDNKIAVKECYKYMPSAEDLLTHLCCHSIFDKREVTPTYGKTIEDLYNKVDMARLRELFKMVFHDASDHLIDVMGNGNVYELYTQYIKYRGKPSCAPWIASSDGGVRRFRKKLGGKNGSN